MADQQSKPTAGKHNEQHIPYRDSVLTWLLRDCLGGNTRTVLVATLSPAEDNLGETISTLRYADRAKRIVNKAVVNEDPTQRIIRQLREEVDSLKSQLNLQSSVIRSVGNSSTDLSLIDRIDVSERLMSEMTKTWEDRLQESNILNDERTNEFERRGLVVSDDKGIRISSKKSSSFLVNLNADPSMNEMLVYYLRQPGTTTVSSDGDGKGDANETIIVINGPGIEVEHATFETDEDGQVTLKPNLNAYTLVNGNLVSSERKLTHGDNIQFGTSENLLFRLNCKKIISKKTETDSTAPEQKNQESVDAADFTVKAIEEQYEILAAKAAGKRSTEITMSKSADSLLDGSAGKVESNGVSAITGRNTKHHQQLLIESRLDEDRKRRHERLKADLANLRRQLIRTNTMVYEANLMAGQYKVPVLFSPTLQIPPSMLEAVPSTWQRRSLLSEPAVLATSQRGTEFQRTLSLSEFESVLSASRSSLSDNSDSSPGWQLASVIDESSQTGGLTLIGVANLYLSGLFYTIPYTYSAPVVSTLGESCGTITVTISRRPDSSQDNLNQLSSMCDSQYDSVSTTSSNDYNTLNYYSQSKGLRVGDFAAVRVNIQYVSGLETRSVALCRYTFWDQSLPTSVQPMFFQNLEDSKNMVTRFEDTKTFRVKVTEEFIDYCADGALAIQIWSYPSLPDPWEEVEDSVPDTLPSAEDHRRAIYSRLLERWQGVTGQINLSVQIQEISNDGQSFQAVPVENDPQGHSCGGIYTITEGKVRRLGVQVKPSVANSSRLPIQIDSIQAVQFGTVIVKQDEDSPNLDTYQSVDLEILMTRWNEALEARTKYLDEQLRHLTAKKSPTKNDGDQESEENRRESVMFQEWSLLLAEKELSEEPEPGSGLPGAEPSLDQSFALAAAKIGLELHRPVVFLDLPMESLTTGYPLSRQNLAGANCFLENEIHGKFTELHIVKDLDNPVSH